MKHCDVCKKALNSENTADGVNGFEKRTIIPEAPEKSRAEEVCESCYKSWREVKDGKE